MYDYKVIPAPARTQKIKGLKTTPERFARLLSETLNQLAAEGWEYLRAETLPCEERKGFTGVRTTSQTVLILRRPQQSAETAQRPALSVAALRTEPPHLAPSLRAERDVPVLRAPVPAVGEGDPNTPPHG